MSLSAHDFGLSAALVWGLVPRILGGLYVVAFASLLPQIEGLVGSDGISPVGPRLSRMRQDYPGIGRFFTLPTVLWCHHGDRFLKALPWLGIGAGLWAVYGGSLGPAALWVAWGLLLSLDVAGLMFPWDCLLFEAGFLGLMLPAVPGLDAGVAATTLPLPALAFMFRWLVVRLMWGFAKLKFIGTRPGDNLYLRGFLTWMPMCTPLGWRLQHAPRPLLRLAYAYMWLVEVVAPLLGLFPGWPRVLGGLMLMSLMAGIWATGNWGFFNLGYGLLCVVLLDGHSTLADIPSLASLWATPTAALTHAVLAVVALGSLFYFVFNSWCSQTWIHWPFDDVTHGRPWLDALIRFYRAIAPFRVVNAYGVFPPNANPPLKLIPVFQGSDDGENWQDFRFRYMPTQPGDVPPIVAPHHPRVDHLIVYAGSGMDDANYLASLLGAGKPYAFSSFSHASWLHRLAQRLLEGSRATRGLLAPDNPFADAPPRYVRVVTRALTPTALGEPAQSGAYWETRTTTVLVPPVMRDADVWAAWLGPPECFHPDQVHHRKAAPALRRMQEALAAGVPHRDAVCVASELTREDVDTFWDTLIARLGCLDREDWSGLDAEVAALRQTHGAARLRDFERILERYAFLLRVRLEPHYHGGAEPRFPARSHFRFHLLLHELVLDGEAMVEAVLAQPERAIPRAERQTEASELFAAAVFRHDTIRYHAASMRLTAGVSETTLPDLPGLFEFKGLLQGYDPPGEQWRPRCERLDNGEWWIEGLGPSRSVQEQSA